MSGLTQTRLKEILDYDPETGVFTWKVAKARRVKIGDQAGCSDSKGYLQIKIDGEKYLSHRLVWMYVHGVFPKAGLDHINGIKGDNRICNLREATNSENLQNQRKAKISNKSTGLLGSSFDKNAGKFKAQIKLNGKQKHLGFFHTGLEAHNAYLTAKREVHPYGTI